MNLARRDALKLCSGVATLLLLPFDLANASNGVQSAIARFTGGITPVEGRVNIKIPSIADNGGAVPVSVSAEGARRIAIFADGNPNPDVMTLSFGAQARGSASTRIRLAASQSVFAVAEMSDGTFRSASRKIVVTVGGCG